MSNRNFVVKMYLAMRDGLTPRITAAASRFNQQIRRMGDATRQLGRNMRELGGRISLNVSAPLLLAGGLAVKSAARFETLKASIKTMTGSQEKANAEFERLLEFAATTPFQLDEVMQSYVKLVALGLDPSEESMRAFGNTASAMGKSLEQMVEAVADAATGEFERLKEFGIKSRVEGNKVKFTFQGTTTTVRNNAEEIQNYLKQIGEVQFAGAMADQMNTLGGAFSSLEDSVSSAWASIGDEIAKTLEIKDFVDDFADAIAGLTKVFQALPAPLKGFIVYGGLVLALLGPLLMMVGQFTIGLGLAVIGLAKFGSGVALLSGLLFKTLLPALWAAGVAVVNLGIAFMATPLGWITAGIAALAVAGYLIVRNWEGIKTFWAALWAGIVENVRAAYAYIEPLIKAIGGAMRLVPAGAVVRAAGMAASAMNAPAQGGAAALQKVDAGGEIRIVIDENRRAKATARMNNPGLHTTVDQGVIMGGAL